MKYNLVEVDVGRYVCIDNDLSTEDDDITYNIIKATRGINVRSSVSNCRCKINQDFLVATQFI